MDELTCISLPNFFAMPLILSYRIIGFFFKLRSTAVIPCTARVRASGFQLLGLEPYKGCTSVGLWFRE